MRQLEIAQSAKLEFRGKIDSLNDKVDQLECLRREERVSFCGRINKTNMFVSLRFASWRPKNAAWRDKCPDLHSHEVKALRGKKREPDFRVTALSRVVLSKRTENCAQK